MEENKKLKKLISAIKNTKFSINYTTENDSVLVHEKINNYLIEFYVFYDKKYYDVISATYLQPEEFSVSYEPLEISSICIYDNKNNIIEFTENEYDLLQIEIEKRIL
ncbi:MAG: hypothetical protein KDC67_16880 [Ignavibacteriae bacterium]|nr:hypothetical protein [Ignavibacteriota bacterium]